MRKDATLLSIRSISATMPDSEVARRRTERRVPHRVPCRLRASDDIPGKPVALLGQTVNLSASGLAVQVGCPVQCGARVEVLLPRVDGEPTRLAGTVAHSRRVLTGTFEVGIRIEPEDVGP